MRMRQKVSISQLPIRLGIFLLLYFVRQSLSAQENNDSTHILRNGASITPDDVLKQANINLFPGKEHYIFFIFTRTVGAYTPLFTQKGYFPALSDQSFPTLPRWLQYGRGIASIRSWSTVRFRKSDKYGRHRAFQQCFTRLSAYFQWAIRVTSPCQCAEAQHVPHHRTGFQHFGRLPLPSFRPCHLESLRIIRHRKLLRNEHP